MKSAILTIPLKLHLEHIQADGSPCHNCSDRIFLRQHRVGVIVGSSDKQPLSLGFSLCGPCSDSAISDIDP